VSTLAQRVAAEVEQAIAASGRPTGQVAAAAGIPRSTMRRRLVSPDRSPFLLGELCAVCEVLEVDVVTVVEAAERGAPTLV
jgi:hypothetical protein